MRNRIALENIHRGLHVVAIPASYRVVLMLDSALYRIVNTLLSVILRPSTISVAQKEKEKYSYVEHMS
jgi:hypothetical protein